MEKSEGKQQKATRSTQVDDRNRSRASECWCWPELLSVLFGVLLFFNPGAGALAVVWLIGAYAIVLGVLLIALGIRLHGMIKTSDRMSPRAV